MNSRRWLSVMLLMMGLILALNTQSALADPYEPYHHHPGQAYGGDAPRHHDFDRHYESFRRSCRGPHNRHYVERVYGGPPSVAYVTPVAPVMGIPYASPQTSQPVPPGLHGQINYNF